MLGWKSWILNVSENFSGNGYLDLLQSAQLQIWHLWQARTGQWLKAGLDQIRAATRAEYFFPFGCSWINSRNIDASTIGFVFRSQDETLLDDLETAYTSLELLLNTDVHDTGLLAQKLENQNRERQK